MFVWNWNKKPFSNKALNFFQEVLCHQHFGSCQNFMSSTNLLAKFQLKLEWMNEWMNEYRALESHVSVNILLWSSHFIEVNCVYIGIYFSIFLAYLFYVSLLLQILKGSYSNAKFVQNGVYNGVFVSNVRTVNSFLVFIEERFHISSSHIWKYGKQLS